MPPILYIHNGSTYTIWRVDYFEDGHRRAKTFYVRDHMLAFLPRPHAKITEVKKQNGKSSRWAIKWQDTNDETQYQCFQFNNDGLNRALDFAESLILNLPQSSQPRRRRPRRSPPKPTATTGFDLDANLIMEPLSFVVPQ